MNKFFAASISFVGLCCGALASIAPAVAVTVATTDTVQSFDLRLSGQYFNISQGSNLRFIVSVSDEAALLAVTADRSAMIRVVAKSPVTSRAQVIGVGDGSIDMATVSKVETAVSNALSSAGGNLTFVVATTTRASKIALTLKDPGVYPIDIEIVQAKKVVATLTTFINVFASTAVFQRMPVAVAVSIASPPTIQPDGTTTITNGARTQLTRLADLLDSKAGPISVQVQPELLDGLERSTDVADNELLTRLRDKFAQHELLTTTFVSFDASSAKRADMTTQFFEQLRRGEDVVDLNNGEATPSRNVWLSRTGVDADGMSLLSDFGVKTLVLLPQASTNLGVLENYAHPYRVKTSNSTSGVPMTLIVSDVRYAQELSGTHNNPVQDAYRIAAELIVQRGEIIAAQGDVSTRLTVLSTNTGEVQDPALMKPLAVALDNAPQLEMRALGDALVDADATELQVPTTTRVDVAATRDQLATLATEIASTSTMFVEGSDVPAKWAKIAAAAANDNLTGDQFDQYIAGVRAQMRRIRQSLQLADSLKFTLSGRESKLRLQIENESDQDLRVIVDLVSAKLQFPSGSQLVTIPAGSATDLTVPVVARSNGTFPLEVVMHTPDGATQVGKRVQLSARVTALAGLGQLVTGAAILILLAWWIAHVRRTRRDNSKHKHPAIR
jgi:hypothetical protein